MAENEVLDVGNRRHYRRWREALADPNLSPSDVSELFAQESLLRLRNNLRRKPLYAVLKACGSDRHALREAIANLKDRALAKFVERAYRITQSTNPLIVGIKIAELLIDTLVGRANRYALRQGNVDGVRHAALDHATSARLEACKSEIARLLASSLRGEPIGRPHTTRKLQPSAASITSLSLMRSAEKQPSKPPNG